MSEDKRTTALYEAGTIAGLSEKLRALPAKEPASRKLNARDVVDALKHEIRDLLKRGYSLEDISEMLRGDAVFIPSGTIKRYLSRNTTKRAPRKLGGRSTAGSKPTSGGGGLPPVGAAGTKSTSVKGGFEIQPDLINP